MNKHLKKSQIDISERKYAKIINFEMRKSDPDYFGLMCLCLDRSWELFDKNKDHFQYLYAARFFELLRLLSQGLRNVEILTNADTTCDKCKSQNGKIYRIEDAIKQMPIPHKECTTYKEDHLGIHTHGWCRCTWLPVVEKN